VDASESGRLVARPLAQERSRLFDEQAETYDRFRPTYPDVVIDELLGPLPAGLDVLDVGCGTGLLHDRLLSVAPRCWEWNSVHEWRRSPEVMGSKLRLRPSKAGTLLVACSTG